MSLTSFGFVMSTLQSGLTLLRYFYRWLQTGNDTVMRHPFAKICKSGWYW